jgi:hypothetical protein
MAYTPFRYRRDEFDMDRERAEDAADKAMDAAEPQDTRTAVEIHANIMRQLEQAEDLKGKPIGLTLEQARKKGYTE